MPREEAPRTSTELHGTIILWCPNQHDGDSFSLKITKTDAGDVEKWHTMTCPVCKHSVVVEVYPPPTDEAEAAE